MDPRAVNGERKQPDERELGHDRERELERRVELVAASRAELDATVGLVKEGIRDATDWRSWVRRHPVATTAVVASAGFLLARTVFGGGGGSRRRSGGGAAEPVLGRAATAAAAAGSIAGAARVGGAGGAALALGRVVGGLVLSAAAKRMGPVLIDRGIGMVTEYLESRIEGRRFDPGRVSGAEAYVPDDDEDEYQA